MNIISHIVQIGAINCIEIIVVQTIPLYLEAGGADHVVK